MPVYLNVKKKRKKDRVVSGEREPYQPYKIERHDEKGIVQGKHSVLDEYSDKKGDKWKGGREGGTPDESTLTSQKTTKIPNPLNKKKPIIKIKKKKVYSKKGAETFNKKGKPIPGKDQTATRETEIELFGKKVYSKKKKKKGEQALKTLSKIGKEWNRLEKRKRKQEGGY